MQPDRVLSSGSYTATITGSARAAVSPEARLEKDHFQAYLGCWENSIPCSHRTESFSFLLGIDQKLL